MILAEKIIRLRKKCGWSQEELAEKLKVSRQSVSKWESAASVPDLNKIIRLSEIFGVSTDFLVKDGAEFEETAMTDGEDEEQVLLISAEEANDFLIQSRRTAKQIAGAAAACVFSPVPLLVLASCWQKNGQPSEALVGAVGSMVLLFIIAVAVAFFIMSGYQQKKFEYIKKGTFELAYGVEGIVSERRERFSGKHLAGLIASICLLILSPIPLIGMAALSVPDWALVFCTAALLTLAAAGVFLIILVSMIEGSFHQLLQVEDYTPQEKRASKTYNKIYRVYWCVMVAVYLGISFLTLRWDRTWIIWPFAGVLFGAVKALTRALSDRKK